METNVLPAVYAILMSVNPLELFAAYGALNHSAQAEKPVSVERRRRARTRLHWPVLLFRNYMGKAVESETRDLSSDGFYCLTNTPFTPGELLMCTIKVPTHDPNGKHLERNLECRVRVVRVEAQDASGAMGIACLIEDYHLARVTESGSTN